MWLKGKDTGDGALKVDDDEYTEENAGMDGWTA